MAGAYNNRVTAYVGSVVERPVGECGINAGTTLIAECGAGVAECYIAEAVHDGINAHYGFHIVEVGSNK